MTGNRCEHILADGRQCGSWAMEGATKCFSHNEATQEQKAIAVRKGGATRQAVIDTPLQQITINTPADIVKLLAQTINEVRDGTLDPRIANTIAYIAGHLIKAYEVSELNGKTEELKSIIAERGLANKRNPYG